MGKAGMSYGAAMERRRERSASRTFCPDGSNPYNLTAANGFLFFVAEDRNPEAGGELWRSDGTESGTFLVKEIYPGACSSVPVRLTNVNRTLFFVANDGVNGDELWGRARYHMSYHLAWDRTSHMSGSDWSPSSHTSPPALPLASNRR